MKSHLSLIKSLIHEGRRRNFFNSIPRSSSALKWRGVEMSDGKVCYRDWKPAINSLKLLWGFRKELRNEIKWLTRRSTLTFAWILLPPDSKSSPATLLRQLILCYDVIKGLKALPRMACEDQENSIFISLGMRTFPQFAQFSVSSPIRRR